MKRYVWVAGCILLVIALSLGLALILPHIEKIQDFVMLYAAGLSIIHRVPLYNTQALIDLMITQLNLEKTFTLFPYPYPPWYALSTFFLAFLSPYQAATAWMLINAAMLLTSAALLTDQWKPIPRILAAFALMMFIPTIGLIIVGQYSVPVLLGASLFLYAVKREDAPFTALGLLLMTFKPHLGLFLLPAGFFWLVFQKTPFARRAILITISGGLLLAALGFIADPAWPVTYIRALISYTTIPGVANRDLSASFSALLVQMLLGYGSAFWATWLSLLLIAIMLVLFWRFKLFKNPETLIIGCVLLTLLGDPYMFNYDYVLMLLPLIYLFRQTKSLWYRIIISIAYLVPWLSLMLERKANILYAISAISLLFILLQKAPVIKNDTIPQSLNP